MKFLLLKQLKQFTSFLIERGKKAERDKAGKEWDAIVKELKQRK